MDPQPPASCSKLRKTCKAWCCKCIFVDFKPNDPPDELYLALRKIKIIRKGPDFWTLALPQRCRWLRSDNRCKDYPHRPRSCRLWVCDDLKKLQGISNHEAAKDECTAA